MRTRSSHGHAQAAAFAARAAARGLRAPLRLSGQDARGWQLGARAGDALVLDEFGELWWCRARGADTVVVRPAWPEEIRSLSATISRAISFLDR